MHTNSTTHAGANKDVKKEVRLTENLEVFEQTHTYIRVHKQCTLHTKDPVTEQELGQRELQYCHIYRVIALSSLIHM